MTASPIVRRRSPAARIGTITVEIVGTDLPGRSCGPDLALGEGRRLTGTLGLTDEQGWPRCATVRPPVIRWTVA